MSIKKFAEKYYNEDTRSINEIVKSWVAEKQARDFLGTTLFAGVTIADVLNGAVDYPFSPDVKLAFKNLMDEKADSQKEIIELFKEKFLIGDKSVEGLINKVQGQIGEDMFIKAVGDSAKLATSGAQEGWDVMIDHGDYTRYVSVKVYDTPYGVIKKMKEVNEKIALGDKGLGNATEIEFAVNSDIYEEVVELSKAHGLENKILNIGATRDDMRDLVTHAAEISDDHPFEHFVGNLLDSAGNFAVVHMATQGLLLALGTKPFESAVEDAAYGTAISVGGATASLITEAALISELEFALGVLSGPVGGAIALAAGISARGVLKRFADRRFIVDRLTDGNKELLTRVDRIANIA